MLKQYSDNLHIKNQFGTDIPVKTINMQQDLREKVEQAMQSKGYKNIYEYSHYQEFIDYFFKFYKEETGQEHEANLCKNDDDVWNMIIKNKYNHIKNLISKRNKDNVIVLYDDGKRLEYEAAYIKYEYNKDGSIDRENSEVIIYNVSSTYETGYTKTEIYLNDFMKISNKIEQELLKRG